MMMTDEINAFCTDCLIVLEYKLISDAIILRWLPQCRETLRKRATVRERLPGTNKSAARHLGGAGTEERHNNSFIFIAIIARW